MKLFNLTLAAIAFSALLSGPPSFAAEKSIAVDPNATNEAIPLRTVINNAQLNFDELFKGAGSAETLTYAATTNLDFYKPNLKVLVLTGGVTFSTTNLVAGKTVAVQITGGGSSRTLAFPAGWVFTGSAVPTALAASKTALLVVRSFGTADANVVAVYSVQP